MNIFSLITLALGIIEPVLSASGLIPASSQPLAQGILAAITAIKAELSSNSGTTLSVNAVTLMGAIAAGLQALQMSNALPSTWSGMAVALAEASAAGTSAYEASGSKVEPLLLQPIAPVA